MAKTKYYSLKNILATNSQYHVIFGERSNGKTYAALTYGIEQFIKFGKQTALLRRFDEDFKGKRGATMFNGIVASGFLNKLTKGTWTDVYYYASKWYLCRYEDDKRVCMEKPFCYGFALSQMEHDKSTSYPDVTTIIFDEFISRNIYLGDDEFVIFTNVLSTIIRDRDDVKIFMLGNTVNAYCPYFNNMGLKHVKDMKQGTIDIYKFGESGLQVAVEFCSTSAEGKKSDKYFAFDNPKLKMITSGTWEIDIYPHAPCKIRPMDIIFTFFIEFDKEMLQGDVVQNDNSRFIYFHRKTTPIKDADHDFFYHQEYDSRPNHRRNLLKPVFPVENKILQLFKMDKVFYQDNECGEVIRNYLNWCKQ